MRDSLAVGASLMALLNLKLLMMTGALIPILLIYLSIIPRDINIVEASKAIWTFRGGTILLAYNAIGSIITL